MEGNIDIKALRNDKRPPPLLASEYFENVFEQLNNKE